MIFLSPASLEPTEINFSRRLTQTLLIFIRSARYYIENNIANVLSVFICDRPRMSAVTSNDSEYPINPVY